MRIKKDPVTRNEYINASGIWVRNFTKFGIKARDINKLVIEDDYHGLLHNEWSNFTLNLPKISDQNFNFEKIIIVSDGFEFDDLQESLLDLDKVAIIAVNHALTKWKLVPKKKFINLYLINNPYLESLSYLPKSKYYPTCIASVRTRPEFLRRYEGNIYLYTPTPDIYFGSATNEIFYIDDYRNCICAAIGLAFQLGVKQLCLFCCDESFNKSKTGAIKLQNELYTYPQHILTDSIIDANLYWLTHQEENPVYVANFSKGSVLHNAKYIQQKEELVEFFNTSKEMLEEKWTNKETK